MSFNLVAFEKADEVVAAYDAGRCMFTPLTVRGLLHSV